jgi:hypothetical protein
VFRLSARTGALDFLDGLADLDAARAGLGAIENGAAAPHAVDLVEDLESLGSGLVAARGSEDSWIQPMATTDTRLVRDLRIDGGVYTRGHRQEGQPCRQGFSDL